VLGLVLALLAVLAFIASFVFGLGRVADRPAIPAHATTPEPLAVPDSRIRVQVLNGSGKPGLARLATDRLRAAGYDVVSIGNAARPAKTSIVLDRVGKPEIAQQVAAALAITQIETRLEPALYLEVTVILGPDFTDKTRPNRPTQ
jgi:hypothetical protein